ncbi:hypothetical protein Tco_1131562 [Tanacetum coccineum]
MHPFHSTSFTVPTAKNITLSHTPTKPYIPHGLMSTLAIPKLLIRQGNRTRNGWMRSKTWELLKFGWLRLTLEVSHTTSTLLFALREETQDKGQDLVCMRTRSQSRNSNRQQQQVPPTFVEPFNLVEPIDNPAPLVVTMVDNRTMAQLLEAPTGNGYSRKGTKRKPNTNKSKHGVERAKSKVIKMKKIQLEGLKLPSLKLYYKVIRKEGPKLQTG